MATKDLLSHKSEKSFFNHSSEGHQGHAFAELQSQKIC